MNAVDWVCVVLVRLFSTWLVINMLAHATEEPRMVYTIRDQLVSSPMRSECVKPRGFARSIGVKSRCFDASLVIDGGLSFPFNDGTRALLEIHDVDALRTVTLHEDPTEVSFKHWKEVRNVWQFTNKTEHVFGVVTRESNWIFSIDLLRGAHCLVILVQSKCLCPGRRHVNVNLVQGVICVRRKCHSLKPGSVLFLVNTKDVIWRQYVDRLEQGCVCVCIYISLWLRNFH